MPVGCAAMNTASPSNATATSAISRRQFLQRTSLVTAGTVAAAITALFVWNIFAGHKAAHRAGFKAGKKAAKK